ncbi:PhoH family protein [Pseudanabaena sp. CCNP1317]|uniref:PhoH family protein n=1 Tax=Pseudanabaena sp. CCNP1317 TaxID=3110253 RepID=UPI002B1F5266|nr:PhoH family protein [Pseudanabaena sp. CCNP1317]MEA5486600.1 PhoH family protein [Pseudanabaena sp. CCNP1317]
MDVTIRVPSGADRVTFLGSGDRNLKMIREALGVHVAARDDDIRVSGEPQAVAAARRVLERIGVLTGETGASGSERMLSRREVLNIIADAASDTVGEGAEFESEDAIEYHLRQDDRAAWEGPLEAYAAGRRVAGKSDNQTAYLEAIRTHDMVFCIGPAGTGKTYLAVAAAVHALKTGRVKKLVLVRPAVEAGEKLGFLPGDLQAKVNPYLRPLFDALHDMMDFPTIKRFMINDVIEVVPLAYMRGRTLNDACIILDEAQNTTVSQMKMFLTRMGQRSKMIVTGDTTQTDLDDPTQSGLIDAARRLRRVPGISFVALDRADIVRHSLVQKIVEAYGDDRAGERPENHSQAPPGPGGPTS